MHRLMIKLRDYTIPIRSLALYALLLFLVVYYQSRLITFRVEHWDIAHFYSHYDFHPLSARDWLEIAFWTPFKDFRFIPLAYLWNFLIFKLLDTAMIAYWILSVLMTVGNAFLLAYLVSALRGLKGIEGGLLAGALFLVFPAKLELTVWTFFTYKLMHTACILAALILFENVLKRGRLQQAVASFLFLFISALFYEASLPIAIVLLGRAALNRTTTLQVKSGVALLTVLFYSAYFMLYREAAHYVVTGGLGIGWHGPVMESFLSIDYGAFLPVLLKAAGLWLTHGILLTNSGLPLEFLSGNHVVFRTVSDPIMGAALSFLWGGILIMALAHRVSWRPVAYLLWLLFFGSVFVLVGRTATNGPGYLPAISMYQYFPTMIGAALLGYLLDGALRAASANRMRMALFIAVFVIMSILGYACYRSIRSYMKINEPVRALIRRVGGMLEAGPHTRISIDDLSLPSTPRHGYTDKEHAYHALSLLYGDRIAPPSQD